MKPQGLTELTPEQFEKHVRDLLSADGATLMDFSVTHLEKVAGAGGDYEIDVVARFTIFGGAEIKVLIECKHHRNPIKREVVMVLESKLRDTKAQKAMLFATCEFQSGALDFAREHHIATLQVTDAGAAYLTKSMLPTPDAFKPEGYVSWLLVPTDQGCSMTRMADERLADLLTWLTS